MPRKRNCTRRQPRKNPSITSIFTYFPWERGWFEVIVGVHFHLTDAVLVFVFLVERSKRDAELVDLIREMVSRYYRRYGSPQVQEELRNSCGKRVSLKKVTRLMRENGL
jgi:hypothetical protein